MHKALGAATVCTLDARPVAAGHAHPRCFVCSGDHPTGLGLTFVGNDDGSVMARFACDESFAGYSGVVHGGVVATLLDGAMTHCLFEEGHVAMTADLHVRYRHPLRVGTPATVRAWVTRACNPLFELNAEVVQEGVLKARAVGKFMRIEGLP